MRKDEFVAGEEWAYRRGTTLGAPAQHVALVAMPIRKGHIKVKIRHVEGELEGMEEFVHATHLRCPWKQWKRIERDEAKLQTFMDHMERQQEIERPVLQAVTAVLLSSGEDLMADEYSNYTRLYAIQVPDLERIAERAGVADKPWLKWPSVKTADGDLYLPNTVLIDLAIAFAKAEPETVNLYLDLEEKELMQEGYRYGELHPHREALKMKPSWALARQWAANTEGRDHLREDNMRLQRLLHDAIRALKDAGEDREATRIERAFSGR